MNQDDKKKAAAQAALEYVERGAVIGVGTGSTTNHFIDALPGVRDRVAATVASSQATARRLERHGFRVIDLNETEVVQLYVDGADEATDKGHLLKGGGGALTREKIVAAASRRFVCIVDDSKLVPRLGAFPLPVEVIPMARRLVARRLAELGGEARARADFTTDNGNGILDVRGLPMDDPPRLEMQLNQIVGVVANGLFCARPAQTILVGGDTGVLTIEV